MPKVKTIRSKTPVTNNDEKILTLKQQEDGSFLLETTHLVIPTDVINGVLKSLHTIYKDNSFKEAYNSLPKEMIAYHQFLEQKLRSQKRWTFLWYAVAICSLAYIFIKGGM